MQVDATYVHLDGFTEQGSPYALRVNGQDHTTLSAVPMLRSAAD